MKSPISQVDANGEISLEDLKQELREDTILVSMMMVNNEIGALEPIENAGEIIKNHKIQPQYFMWMRSRHTESSRSFRNGCISICFLSADTRFMDRKALDFYT